MTRPGGTTPRGLPYPGSTGTIADTPKALQNLAEAITAQLSSVGSGIIFDNFTGLVHTSASIGAGQAYFDVPFPNLGAVLGGVAIHGTFLGGPLRAGWCMPPGPGPGGAGASTRWVITPASNSKFPLNPADSFANLDITICAVGWGPPK